LVFLFFLALTAFEGGLLDVTGEPVLCSLPVTLSVDSIDSDDVDSDLLLFLDCAAAAAAVAAVAAALTLFFLAMLVCCAVLVS
jgi:hypothetical protein